jgi:hypothetical protein
MAPLNNDVSHDFKKAAACSEKAAVKDNGIADVQMHKREALLYPRLTYQQGFQRECFNIDQKDHDTVAFFKTLNN